MNQRSYVTSNKQKVTQHMARKAFICFISEQRYTCYVTSVNKRLKGKYFEA